MTVTETTETAERALTEFEEALKSVTPISTAPFPYTELQEKWLEDLETCPAHWQGEGRLLAIEPQGSEAALGRKPRRSGFCCLGRACVVAGAGVKLHSDSIEVGFEYLGSYHDAFLPRALAEEMQMETGGEFRLFPDAAGDENQVVTIPGFGGYSCLTSMNDGYETNYECLTFRQIAAFIRHDPWRVFSRAPLPETASIEATA